MSGSRQRRLLFKAYSPALSNTSIPLSLSVCCCRSISFSSTTSGRIASLQREIKKLTQQDACAVEALSRIHGQLRFGNLETSWTSCHSEIRTCDQTIQPGCFGELRKDALNKPWKEPKLV